MRFEGSLPRPLKEKDYKITVSQVFKFRDGSSEERTILERSVSEMQQQLDESLEWEKKNNPDLYPKLAAETEPITLADLMDDIMSEIE